MDLGMMCNADNQDALYPNSAIALSKSKICSAILGKLCPIPHRSSLEEDGTDFFIVTGVNHNATTSALYSNIAMYNYARLESVGSFTSIPPETDSSSYVGSANGFL